MRPALRHVLLRAATPTANAERTEGRIEGRTVYTNGISISKKERETMIHITIELYTYQGTIPVIFLSLFATFASLLVY